MSETNNENFTPREPRCGHKGKWQGIGQSAVVDGSGITIIATTVCGECGDVAISVNNMKPSAPTKGEGIMVPSINRR